MTKVADMTDPAAHRLACVASVPNWRPGRKKMLADGLVEECPPPKDAGRDDARRRYYRVTKRGKLVAREETARLALLVELGWVFQP